MADLPGDEAAQDVSVVVDTEGSSEHFSGLAPAVAINIPSSPGNVISLAFISNFETKKGETIEFSFDNGVTYSTLKPNNSIGWPLKGNITQLKIRRGASATADASYDVILNRVV